MEIEIKKMKLSKLTPTEKNPRKISKEDLERLKSSVKSFPKMLDIREIVVDENCRILGGHQRVKALIANGEKEATVKVVSGLTEAEKDEFIIRDNVQNGEWDEDILANEWNADDLNEWGLNEMKPYKEITEDEPAPVDKENTYSVVGDVYQIGKHRIFCGSFEDEKGLAQLFGNKKAICTFTDPPYNVDYVGKTKDSLTIKNDSKTREEFVEFLSKAFNVVAKYTETGGGVISWMSDFELFSLWDAYKRNGINFKQTILWVKDHFVMGRKDYQFQYEPALYGIDEGSYDKESEEDEGESMVGIYARNGGKFQANRKISNTWFFARPSASKFHPTMKPVGLCAKGVLSLSERGDIVFDPFSGSGSTLIACEQTDRKCYGCEIDPKYCDVIRKRWVKLTTGSEDNWQELTPKETI